MVAYVVDSRESPESVDFNVDWRIDVDAYQLARQLDVSAMLRNERSQLLRPPDIAMLKLIENLASRLSFLPSRISESGLRRFFR